MTHEDLQEHAFIKEVFTAVRPVMAAEYDAEHGRGEQFVPDEHEFYMLRVGNRLASLLSHCEQLSHCVVWMSSYRETPASRRAGITRAKHLRYAIENYIVRTQTLYDLVLHLVDAVFHLLNEDSQCRHTTIVKNLKVKRTDIPKLLKPLKKKLGVYEQDRHSVVHRGRYQEKDLYDLEVCSELEAFYSRDGEEVPEEFSSLPDIRKDLVQALLRSRKAMFTRFNSRTMELISDVLDGLHPRFGIERRRISGDGVGSTGTAASPTRL